MPSPLPGVTRRPPWADAAAHDALRVLVTVAVVVADGRASEWLGAAQEQLRKLQYIHQLAGEALSGDRRAAVLLRLVEREQRALLRAAPLSSRAHELVDGMHRRNTSSPLDAEELTAAW